MGLLIRRNAEPQLVFSRIYQFIYIVAEVMAKLQSARVITAIKTPYRSDGKFDLEAYGRMVDLQIQNGVDGLVIGGTTGEGHLMSWDEHIMLIAHTAKEFGRNILVIGNTGNRLNKQTSLFSQQCKAY